MHFSSQDAAYSNFSSGLECTINTRFALTSGEKNVAASQRGVRPPCTSVITGKIPHMYMSIQTSHSREGENAANTAALLISPPPPPAPTPPPPPAAEALELVKCRNVLPMPMLS